MEKLLYVMVIISAFIVGDYLWISKILFLEIDYLTEKIKDIKVLNVLKTLKNSFNLNPKYLYYLFKTLNEIEKSFMEKERLREI